MAGTKASLESQVVGCPILYLSARRLKFSSAQEFLTQQLQGKTEELARVHTQFRADTSKLESEALKATSEV